ncbi:MAG: hypothetical protein DME19_15075 [Verrucomicrobia bacterium]|nr:MAG: hypothetical protein DME19_15075 [Verrucomicrobiota bacterium]
MTNDEFRSIKEIRMTKIGIHSSGMAAALFGLDHFFVIRHSSFGFLHRRQCPNLVAAVLRHRRAPRQRRTHLKQIRTLPHRPVPCP